MEKSMRELLESSFKATKGIRKTLHTKATVLTEEELGILQEAKEHALFERFCGDSPDVVSIRRALTSLTIQPTSVCSRIAEKAYTMINNGTLNESFQVVKSKILQEDADPTHQEDGVTAIETYGKDGSGEDGKATPSGSNVDDGDNEGAIPVEGGPKSYIEEDEDCVDCDDDDKDGKKDDDDKDGDEKKDDDGKDDDDAPDLVRAFESLLSIPGARELIQEMLVSEDDLHTGKETDEGENEPDLDCIEELPKDELNAGQVPAALSLESIEKTVIDILSEANVERGSPKWRDSYVKGFMLALAHRAKNL